MIVGVALVALLLNGAIAGLYFAFSVAVTRGLDRIEASSAIYCMQSMNRVILNPFFLVPFFLSPVSSLFAAWLALSQGQLDAAAFFVIGGIVYLCGSLFPTVRINVPLNDRLERAPVSANGDETRNTWLSYSRPWTRWNSIRALMTFVSLACIGAGLAALE